MQSHCALHVYDMRKVAVGSQGGLVKFGERHVHDHVRGQAVDCCQSGSLDRCQGLCNCGYRHGLAEWFKDSASSILGQCDHVHGQAVDGGRSSRSCVFILLVLGSVVWSHIRCVVRLLPGS